MNVHSGDIGLSLPDNLARDGFVHLPGFIPESEVAELREAVCTHHGAPNIHDTPLFDALIKKYETQKTVQSLLPGPIFYIGTAGTIVVSRVQPTRLHDDAKGIPIKVDEPRTSLFNVQVMPHNALKDETWPVYRLFIYLDDHTKQSGGTKIRRGSHKKVTIFSRLGFKALARGRFRDILWPGQSYVNPNVKAGDAVLFNLKCKHAGLFVRLRGPLKRLAMNIKIDNFLKHKFFSWAIYPFPKVRASLVIDFVTESDWARGFQVNRILHPSNIPHLSQFFDCNKAEFRDRLASAGIQVLSNPSMVSIEGFLRSK